MHFPPPSERQARLIWLAVTGLASALLVALVAALVWGLGVVLRILSPVVWPLAVAGILAYLLDPVVDFFERKRVPRLRAIVLVFLMAFFLVLTLLSSVVPRLVVETQQLVSNVPSFVVTLETRAERWISQPPAPVRTFLERMGVHWQVKPPLTNTPPTETGGPAPAPQAEGSLVGQLDRETIQKATQWIASLLKPAGAWLLNQLSRLTGVFGVVAGLALIPIYLFYFLQEKRSISQNWTAYVPVRQPRLKQEVVFIVGAINDYLIAFFRGQVLVAMCDGVLYALGFALIGLPYAFLIGAAAMLLTIIPFVGAIVTCGVALLIALLTFGDWQHPLLVLLVFAVVQSIEGYVLQPRILGDRVGLHPMVIIIAIMTGTTLLGGVLGGLLAIPLAAALRVVLARYLWRRAPSESDSPAP